MKIIVAGGGTGGHIYPNIAVLEILKERVKKLDVLYVGSKKGMEAELIPRSGYKFRGISCGKLRRYFSLDNFADIFRTVAGIAQSKWIILRFRPDVIFCKGGYVSLPMAIAGGILGKPVIIHESDLEMGLANKIAARFARVICVSFPETLNKFKGDKRVVLTGNPVRRELARGSADLAWELSGLKAGKPVVLVMGGSQGSDYINELIWKNLSELLKNYQILHSCGKGKMKKTKFSPQDGYFACENFGVELRHFYAITDIFVSRAGAGSLAEIELIKKPAILIPLVQGSRGDQVKNAESFVANHQAIVVEEGTKVDLKASIDNLLKQKEHRSRRGGQNAAEKIAELICSLTDKK